MEESSIPLYHLIGVNSLNYGKVKDTVPVLEQVVRIWEETGGQPFQPTGVAPRASPRIPGPWAGRQGGHPLGV